MIAIVEAFGAPVTDPHGKSARKIGARPSTATSASTVEVSCHTVGYRSRSNIEVVRTPPNRAMRPRSFRSRSTINEVLGSLLVRTDEFRRAAFVLGFETPARRRALHRSRRHDSLVDREEQLR